MKITPIYCKSFIFSFALATAGLSTLAQTADLKEKHVILDDNSRITYHVKNNTVKEGPYYIKVANSEQLLIKGAYSDNKRSGNWFFFNEKGTPEAVYNFQLNKLAFIDSTLLNQLTINIPGEDKEVVDNTKIPVLLSPMRLFLSEMSNNIAIPREHFKTTEALPIKITSVIDVDGSAKYLLTYVVSGKEITQQIKLKRSAFEINWIPAIYNDKPIKSEVIINTAINSTPDSEDGFRRFRWNDKS